VWVIALYFIAIVIICFVRKTSFHNAQLNREKKKKEVCRTQSAQKKITMGGGRGKGIKNAARVKPCGAMRIEKNSYFTSSTGSMSSMSKT